MYLEFSVIMQKIDKTILEISDIINIKPNYDEIKVLPRNVCESTECIIFDKEWSELYVITTNNKPEELKNLLEKIAEKGFSSEIYYTSTEWFKEAMKWYDKYEQLENERKETAEQERIASGDSAIWQIKKVFEKRETLDTWDFIVNIIRLAFQTWASDLHFQSQENEVILRIRIDGVLQEVLRFTHDDFKKYLQKIKFISGVKMNVDYIPQDGRFSFDAVDKDWKEKKIDARVSFMPGIEEESTVIRFLDPSKWISTFEWIWFTWRNYEVLKRWMEKNTWITIFTWPTWAWKTTTLYTILNYLNDGKRKIITLEDPIEYELDGIQQSQINYNKWYDYANWLKAVLRHDPDIILVWETRDQETAEISINAALTWHKVFTTLHTNSAIEGISRLLNMWVKPYMLAPSLNLVVAQRLVRRLCPHCATKKLGNFSEKAEIEEAIKKIKDSNPSININFNWLVPCAVWCKECNETWFKWRFAIIETFEITDNIRTLIFEWSSDIEIYAKAREQWFLTLKEDWILKMLEWMTTLDELRRIL